MQRLPDAGQPSYPQDLFMMQAGPIKSGGQIKRCWCAKDDEDENWRVVV
jgi:hypothetical protein